MSDLQLYTAAEVADLLRLNPQVVQRKLQAGEIPGYRIGREWRVEREQLLAWLELHSNQRARGPEANFFTADGRLTALPTGRAAREAALARIAEAIEPGRTYTEKEISALLRRFHDDVATIRRELVGAKHVVRTRDGIYKRTGPRTPALRRA